MEKNFEEKKKEFIEKFSIEGMTRISFTDELNEIESLIRADEREKFCHKSDCSVFNEPAYPNKDCDCGVIQKIQIFKDGNQYCVLLGENLQEGIAGFGDTILKALRNFIEFWQKENNNENKR